jgi:polysaccharide chain length determinant protein (PEP-CTERM system associated)
MEVWRMILGALPAIWKYRGWGLLTTVVVGLLGAAFSILRPGEYEARARAYVDTQSILKPLMVGMTVQPNVEQKVQMVARTLVSRPNLEQVAKAAGLDKDLPPGGSLESIVSQMERKISLKPAGGTNFYSISYRSPSQEGTLKVVQSLLDIFVQSTQSHQQRDTRQALAFIDDQISLSKKKLEETENALKDFKIANIAVMPNLAQDYVARSAEAQREQQQAKLELRQATQARGALQRRLAGVAETYASGGTTDPLAPRILSETETRLQAARARLDDFLTRYTEAHPDVVNTRRIVLDLEKQLDRERARIKEQGPKAVAANLVPNRLHQDLSVSLADAEARVASLSARLAEAEVRIAQNRELSKTIPKVEAQFIQLNRDYASNKSNYEQLLTRRASAQMAESMEEESAAKEFRIVDPPMVSPRTVTPNRPLLLLATCFGSIAAGIAVAYLLNLKSPAFFDKLTLQEAAELPVLGAISFVHSRRTLARHRRSVVAYSTGLALYSLTFLVVTGYFLFEPQVKRYLLDTDVASTQTNATVTTQ